MGIGSNKAAEVYEFVNEFYPKNIKRTIHLITQQLKQDTSLNVEYLCLPFRKEQSNEALLRFLNTIMPKGDGKPLENENKLIKIIKKTAPGVLFQSLKYIWSRTILPTINSSSNKSKKWNGIVGYEAYLKFQEIETEKMFPKKSFLEVMPRCLTSPDHASLVYDMFDLITTISSNAPKNKMSCRKISKMFAIWAFDCASDVGIENTSFVKGIERWAPKAEAMFHLSLAFIRSFAPENENIDKNDFPVALLHVLKDNSYPPELGSAKNMLQVPVITLHRHYKEENLCSNLKPWSLMNNINSLFKLDDFTILENDSKQIDPINMNKKLKLSRQQKALIKSIFSDKSSIETISKKMSKQSKKIMKEFTTRHSSFQAGWVVNGSTSNVENGEYDYLTWTTCYIDDFYIWTWMSSLSNEEAPAQRDIFGRSLILEFEFDAFKKWVVFEESSKIFQQRAPERKETIERISVSPPIITNAKQIYQQSKSEEITKREPVSKPAKEVVKKRAEQSLVIANEDSFVDNTNSSSIYNNKTIINGYMTNGDITDQLNYSAADQSIEQDSYELPPVNVDESAFRIDLPDIDPSQITINGENNTPANIYGNNESGDSLNEAINGLDDEMRQVESQIVSHGIPGNHGADHSKPVDQFGNSGTSTIRSLQFNNSQQKLQNNQPPVRKQPSPAAMDLAMPIGDNTIAPQRSPERRNLYAVESLDEIQQSNNKTLAPNPQHNYHISSQTNAPPPVPQQHYPQMAQKQMPPPVQQQYQPSLSYIQPTTSDTLYEQPRFNNNSSTRVANGSPPITSGSTPISSESLPSAHHKKPSFNAPIPQQQMSAPQQQMPPTQQQMTPTQQQMHHTQLKATSMQVPQQVLQQKPKLPRAFTMQNLAQQPQPNFYHNKQPSVSALNVKQMTINNNTQRPPFQNNQPPLANHPQKQMQPIKGNRQQFQQPAMPRKGGMPRSQSYNQLPQTQNFAPAKNPRLDTQFMPQPRATMTTQQNPYLRQQTMAAAYNPIQQQQQQQPMMGGQQGFMPQQYPAVGNRYGGMVMPTSHKGKKKEKMNLQQQLRNGAFGM